MKGSLAGTFSHLPTDKETSAHIGNYLFKICTVNDRAKTRTWSQIPD